MMRILIVDDEKLARERLIRMVETLDGYEVAGIADSGEEAVRQSIRLAPDIVLLDIRMPGMDGMEAGRQLASLASPPAVIYCTAFGEHAIEAFEVNASAYLMKPVRREALIDSLARVATVNKVQMESVLGSKAEPDERTRTHISAKTRRGIEFGDRLVRIHRNALVMTDHLEGLERDPSGHYQVRMRGVDERLDVSRRHVSGLRRLVQSL
jgi:two-component system response regulator AlgR